jgi:hypothetical protein
MKMRHDRTHFLSISDEESDEGGTCLNFSPRSSPSSGKVIATVHSSNVVSDDLSDPVISFKSNPKLSPAEKVDVDGMASTLACPKLSTPHQDSTSQDICMVSSDQYDSATSKEGSASVRRSPRFSRFVSVRDDLVSNQVKANISDTVLSKEGCVSPTVPNALSDVLSKVWSATSASFSLLLPSQVDKRANRLGPPLTLPCHFHDLSFHNFGFSQ